MAKGKDICTHLINFLPTLTNLFSDQVNISSLTRSGSTVTAITSTPHGLITGSTITIKGAIAPVLVTELTSSTAQDKYGQDIYIAHGLVDLSTPHDLTEGYQTTILITGAVESGYNGLTLPLLTVPNRFEFTYQLPSQQVSPATGSTILLWDGKERGYNGRFVITVIDATTFTYTIDEEPYSPAFGTITMVKKVRIAYSSTIERILDSYTKKQRNELWGFVVLADTLASKDRQTFNDGVYEKQVGSAYRQLLYQSFKFYSFAPTTTEIAGEIARDQAEVDIQVPLFKSLLNAMFPTYYTNNFQQLGVVFEAGRQYLYNAAYYVHEWTFQIIIYLVDQDTHQPSDNVAFRDIEVDNYNSPDELVTLGVNLDDQPYNP